MAVKKKANRISSFEEVIERGGKTAEESSESKQINDEFRFTLRISKDLIKKIDDKRNLMIGKVSRNQFINEAIDFYLN